VQHHQVLHEVCPEHIKITDNGIILMKGRVGDRKYDPLVWLGSKLFRRNRDWPTGLGVSAGRGHSLVGWCGIPAGGCACPAVR
jgi:succinate dehydrogenase / fumarate reductase iron-sulfur subunit